MFRAFFDRLLQGGRVKRSKVRDREFRRGRLRRARQRRIWLEPLEDRRLLSVDITAFDAAAGMAAFTGDRGAANQVDNLVLSVSGGNLAHNLLSIGGTGTYSDPTDFDPGPETATIAVGSGTAPLLTVNLLGGNDSLTLDNTGGLVAHPVVYSGGGQTAASGDGLRITVPAGQNAHWTPGTDSFVISLGTGPSAPIRFEAVESITVTGAGVGSGSAVTINGTNGDDDITVIGDATFGGIGSDATANDFTVSINDGPTVQYLDLDALTVEGMAGDDDIDIDLRQLRDTAITVNGGTPAADADVVTVSVGERSFFFRPNESNFTPNAPGGGTLGVNFLTTAIDLNGIERLIYDGQGVTGTFRVTATSDNDTIVHRAGLAPDAGAVRVNTLLEIEYVDLGTGAFVDISDPGGTRDTLQYVGTPLDDVFRVGTTGNIELATDPYGITQTHVISLATGIERLLLNGLEGDDTFIVLLPQPYEFVGVDGGGPGNSDMLAVVDEAAGIDQSLEVYPGLVPGTGSVEIDDGSTALRVAYWGTETVGLLGNASLGDGDDVTIHEDGADNTWNIHGGFVFSAEFNGRSVAGTGVQIDDHPAINVGDFRDLTLENSNRIGPGGVDRFRSLLPTVRTGFGGTFTVTGAGADTLEVVGSDGEEEFSVVPGGGTQGTATSSAAGYSTPIRFGGLQAVALIGLEGDDTFTVEPIADVTISVQAGGSATADTLNVIVPSRAEVIQGAESTSGTIGRTGRGDVDFSGVEFLNVDSQTAASRLEIVATSDEDTLAVQPLDDPQGLVWINDGPVIRFNTGADNFDVLDLSGGFGRDSFSVIPIDGVVINALGGDPEAAGDTAVIRAVSDTEFEPFPGTPDQATLRFAGWSDVNLGGIESVTLEGLNGNANVRVITPATDNDVVNYTPGPAPGAGLVEVVQETPGVSLMPLQFENFGPQATLTIDDAAGGADALAYFAGDSFDDIRVEEGTNPGTGRVNRPFFLPVETEGVEILQVHGGGGDDQIVVSLPVPYETINVFADDPGRGDNLLVFADFGTSDAMTVVPDATLGRGFVDINAGSVRLTYTGLEHLSFVGNGPDDDTLTILDDQADNLWTVGAGPIFGDRIQIDDRESIDYSEFHDVTLNNTAGTDRFEIHPTELAGFDGVFTVDGNARAPIGDVLHLVGTPGNDTVTSTATAVSVNGVAITAGLHLAEVRLSTLAGDDNVDLDLNLASVRKVVEAGEGNDIVNMLGTVDAATIFGGDGDDTLIGSPAADLIFGGRGNDILIGAGGDDTLYGEEGDDIFGNPSAAANGVADDPGNDRFFGGPGSDLFVWEPGDGSDTIEGGSGEADVLAFFGSAAAETFNVFAKLSDPARAILFRSADSITMDMAGVEQINVAGNAGDDRYVVGRANDGDSGANPAPTSPYTDPTATLSDLSASEVRAVNLVGGAGSDLFFVDGRPLHDNLLISLENAATGTVRVAGLPYDVRILGATTADRLTVRGNEGDDTIKSVNPTGGGALNVESVIEITLAGGAGNDVLAADAILTGGIGDDFLEGGAGAGQFFGNQGEDTMVGNGGHDTLDGGPDFDTILVRGTSFADRIDLRQDSPTQLRYEVGNAANLFDGLLGGAGTETDTLVAGTVEEVRIEAEAGDDTIRVAHDDSLVAAGIAANMLRIDVHGGEPGASDRLTVVDDGPGDTTVQRIGGVPGDGSFTQYAFELGNPANPIIALPPVVYTEVEYAGLQPISPVTGGTGTTDKNGRLFVFKPDPFEQNQSLANATFLGANQTINLDPVIDPGVDVPFGTPGDEDWYRIVAEVTGTLDIQVYFRQQGTLANGRAGLPGDGNLDLAVYDADGLWNGTASPIAGAGTFGTNDADNDERVRMPVVAGQTYYLRVTGAPRSTGDAPNTSSGINVYGLSAVNLEPPAPFDLELADGLTILTGTQEAPPNGPVLTVANGTANFQYDAAANTFDLDLFVSGLELVDSTPLPEVTAAHIHQAATGGDGPAIVTLASGVAAWVQEPAGIRLRVDDAPFSAVAADIAALLDGETYINVHSTLHPDGEIRGQIQIPNVPGVSDSGRSQFDDVTQDNTPTIFLRLDDAILLNDLPGNAIGTPDSLPPDQLIPIPHNPSTAASTAGLAAGFRVAIYDETSTHGPVPLGFAQPVPNLNGVYSFTFDAPLSEGSHFISARVQMIDPADNDLSAPALTPASGFGPRSTSLQIVVDTVPPPVFFGLAAEPRDGLSPDPGVIPQPPLFVDLKTNDTTPVFWGVAEADAVVRVWLDFSAENGRDDFDLLLGTSVASPEDGTNPFPNGQWTLTSLVDLNAPQVVAADSDPLLPGVQPIGVDGLRRLLVTAEDAAGNVNPGEDLSAQSLEIFLDTQGPQVTGLLATDLLGLVADNMLLRFNAASPFSVEATLPITGLLDGDVVVGIGRRPADGLVYAVADGPDPDALYTVNPRTGAATFVASLSEALSGATFGVDFNPVADVLQIVSDADINYSVDPATGVVTVQPALNPGDPAIAGAAYSQNVAGASYASLYTIDFEAAVLNRQDAATGMQTEVGPLGIQVSASLGFDIAENGIAFAALTDAADGRTGLYTLDLTTGAVTLIGDVDDGEAPLLGLTAVSEYDIFDPKPATDGPTPLLTNLYVRVQDLPGRQAPFDNPALNPLVAEAVGHYTLIGDANGIIPIQSVQFIPDPVVESQPAGGTIVLTFFEPLPDDRFTLVLSDSLVDDVGNALDGESNADEPQEDATLPSGDGQPGGDFVARFTVDSRPEVATAHSGSVWVDTNGNFTFDPDNVDFTHRDITYLLGFTTDNMFAGNFSPSAGSVADGFDKLAAYGRVGSNFRWLIDTDNPPTGIVDLAGINGFPVAGNFDGNAVNGDEVGLLANSTWWLDTDHDFQVDTSVTLRLTGLPIVGDFDGDGVDDLGTWKEDQFTFQLATGPGTWIGPVLATGFGPVLTLNFGFIGTREKPVAADMDQDGIDDIGLWVPDRAGVAPDEQGEWYFLVSNDFDRTARRPGTLATLAHPFEPVPFGNDLFASYGNEFAVPLLGNFDPPVSPTSSAPAPLGRTNLDNPFDINGDGVVTALDVLVLINEINGTGPRTLVVTDLSGPYLDSDGDGSLTAVDVLFVINHINLQPTGSGEGEGAVESGAWRAASREPRAESRGEVDLPVAFSWHPTDNRIHASVTKPRPLDAASVDRYFGHNELRAEAALDGDLADAALVARPRRNAGGPRA